MKNIQEKIKEVVLEIQDLELKKKMIIRRIKENKPVAHQILNNLLNVINKEIFVLETKLRKLKNKI